MKKTTLKFDELNVLDSKSKTLKDSKKGAKPKPIPYREYFGGMYITPEEMYDRIELAEEIEDVMIYILAYWSIASDADLPIEEVKESGIERLTSVIAKHSTIDPYLEKHINDVVNEVVDVTERHKAKQDEYDEESDVLGEMLDDSGEETKSDYWTSKERAEMISENEANGFYEYFKYTEAKKSGVTQKTWITEKDEKVRLTHLLVEEKTIGIDGLFLVGDSKMRFPMDWLYDPDPREVINCRCTCEYK